MKRNRFIILTCLTLLFLGLSQGALLAADAVTITTDALREVAVFDEQGRQKIIRVAVDQAVPGDQVIYVNTVTNNVAKPVTGVVVSNPVPADMRYVDGSATAQNAALTFSVDGGKTFGVPGQLYVIQPDGTVRQATADDFTNIRWTLLAPLAPQAVQQVEFQAIVK